MFFSSGKAGVIGQGTAPVVVPVTLAFFRLFSHTFKIKPTLDNTLVDIILSFVCHNVIFCISTSSRNPTIPWFEPNKSLKFCGLARGFLV